VIVETRLADRGNQRIRSQLDQARIRLLVEIDGVVRMTTRRGAQQRGRCPGECQRRTAAIGRGAGDHELHDARSQGATQNLFAIVIVAVVREIDADVDERRSHRKEAPAASLARAMHNASTSSSGWFQETTSRASPEPLAPQS